MQTPMAMVSMMEMKSLVEQTPMMKNSEETPVTFGTGETIQTPTVQTDPVAFAGAYEVTFLFVSAIVRHTVVLSNRTGLLLVQW